jgi:hypothetical protein
MSGRRPARRREARASVAEIGEFSGTPAVPPPISLAYVRLDDPPGVSPITTVGRYATVETAQAATRPGRLGDHAERQFGRERRVHVGRTAPEAGAFPITSRVRWRPLLQLVA